MQFYIFLIMFIIFTVGILYLTELNFFHSRPEKKENEDEMNNDHPASSTLLSSNCLMVINFPMECYIQIYSLLLSIRLLSSRTNSITSSLSIYICFVLILFQCSTSVKDIFHQITKTNKKNSK